MSSPARGLSTRAAQAENTRQQILDTAQRLFLELGYDATSLQMIADELGLTKAAVYYHFRAKSDILRATMRPRLRRIGALLDEAEAIRGRRQRIEHVVNGVVEFMVEGRHYAVMASTDPAAKRHKFDAEVTAMRQRGLQLFFGDNPTADERLSFNLMAAIADSLPDLVNLTDDELRDALRTAILRVFGLRPTPLRLSDG